MCIFCIFCIIKHFLYIYNLFEIVFFCIGALLTLLMSLLFAKQKDVL